MHRGSLGARSLNLELQRVLNPGSATGDRVERFGSIFAVGLVYVFSFLIPLTYYFGMEAVFGKTVGKLITGTKVVSETGGRPSIGQFLGRSFVRLVPFEAFSFLGDST